MSYCVRRYGCSSFPVLRMSVSEARWFTEWAVRIDKCGGRKPRAIRRRTVRINSRRKSSGRKPPVCRSETSTTGNKHVTVDEYSQSGDADVHRQGTSGRDSGRKRDLVQNPEASFGRSGKACSPDTSIGNRTQPTEGESKSPWSESFQDRFFQYSTQFDRPDPEQQWLPIVPAGLRKHPKPDRNATTTEWTIRLFQSTKSKQSIATGAYIGPRSPSE